LFSLVVCIVAAVSFRKQYRWVLLPLLMFAILFMLSNFSTESENLLISRVNLSLSTDSPEIRVLMMAGALQQFYDSPWVGSAIIEQQFNDYPHNMFIEAAMAVGLVGLLLLIFISLRAVRRVFRALLQGNLLVPLLALQMLTAAQVSGSISQSASMWMFLALFAGAAVRQRRHLPSSGLVAHAPHPLKIK
jgi:O-antigen ligase